ncbi:DUF2510 domain-containing protein [Nocardioides sp. Arc9.136]|uniref:DUF2510 domain-containing protein n=1 Tax=Nocardioides sp. Arc9.136 TaxID=2996826 RepID=UPI0026663292|nr:DUF2510 domain-containing protein [Nocardioides sp. Arc9.136]WKN49232.1 DUF2510 domain-containing protein [Nocardioides sp. Arc9.136]
MTSTPPPPGWYPDASEPALLRWWDGRAWTPHTAPVRPQPAHPAQPAAHHPAYPSYPPHLPAHLPTHAVPGTSRTAKVLIGLGAAVFALASVGVAIALVVWGDDLAASGDPAFADLGVEEACGTTVEEAVRISEEQAPPVRLLDVRDVEVVVDARGSVEVPTGPEEATVLTCRGTGTWSDGDRSTPVIVGVTVDSEGDYFVHYEATTGATG